MDKQKEWELLTTTWAESLKKARLGQAAIDDKMSSYLRGTCDLPTLTELAKVEYYWSLHVQSRQATNRFICQQIYSKHSQSSNIDDISKPSTNAGSNEES